MSTQQKGPQAFRTEVGPWSVTVERGDGDPLPDVYTVGRAFQAFRRSLINDGALVRHAKFDVRTALYSTAFQAYRQAFRDGAILDDVGPVYHGRARVVKMDMDEVRGALFSFESVE